jgi:hypothetical protein
MNRSVMTAALAAAGALALPGAAGAAPKLQTTPSFKGSRLVVTVTSAKTFTKRTRPRAVKVVAGGVAYKLKPGTRTARKSTWRSGTLSAGQRTALYAKQVRITVKTLAGTVTQKRTTPPAPGVPAPGGPAPGGPAPGGGGIYTPPPVPTPPSAPELTSPNATLTRDDTAGRAAVSGDLLLERVESGSVTMTYRRIFLYGTGVFRVEKADWNQVSGEICDSSARLEGTWSFLRGYTFPEKGGGVLVEIAIRAGGQSGRDVLVFGNAEPNSVYVGNPGTRYDRNPNLRDQC